MTDDLYTECPACGGTGKQRGRGGSVGLGDCGVCDGERYVPVGVSRDEVKAALATLLDTAVLVGAPAHGRAIARCIPCGGLAYHDSPLRFEHRDGCPVAAARELLAKLADDTPDSQKPNLSEGMDELRARYHQYFDDKPDGWPRNEND